MHKNLAKEIIEFNKKLAYNGALPNGFRVLNPYLENPETWKVMQEFYYKYYNDSKQRRFIIGINPSRHGAGVTGVPFTDTKRLASACGIFMKSAHTHEISSVYMYDMIEAYGGPDLFYAQFYINSPFPLAITREMTHGKLINANYYDDKVLFEMVKPFMISSLKEHIKLGLNTSEVFILGKKNALFLDRINKQERLFGKMTVLEHPRYIQQYKSKEKDLYIDKYLTALQPI
ncbi:SMUG2 DNA glycosylase family protein [Sphingobacterium sp. UT-1RO-CII-1]|uniref:SMUG2 DNA glycosylase family protein n=1 Tax=Sphingobacterium sp. UT-1RO-CII-1 TaxID=2995225 RepID=UPI00227A8F1A|nr:SMUG2 DNA glycosylase family protein [Sphingobacterium sp. UT-1RO-CII-1]MCY4779204.1 SMUG2 DNA glycosylase family protein [Sphingobacterium sp. UT-1RO-CII-1]